MSTFSQRLFVDTRRNTAHWTESMHRPLKKNQFLLKPDTLITWITTLIHNTVVTHNGTPYNQVIGLPMGTNCAVNLANCALYSYELDYITKQLQHANTTQNYERIDALKYTKRYLDDILTANNPKFNDYKYEIYNTLIPNTTDPMLVLEEEASGLPIHCLDMHIYYNTKYNCIASKLHTKSDDPKFDGLLFTRYPHPHSFSSTAYLYNTFTAEVHRIKRVNSHYGTFIVDIRHLIRYMLNKGYNYNRLYSKLHNYIKRNLPLYTKMHPSHTTRDIFATLRYLKPHVDQRPNEGTGAGTGTGAGADMREGADAGADTGEGEGAGAQDNERDAFDRRHPIAILFLQSLNNQPSN